REQAPAVAGECQAAYETGMAAEGAKQLSVAAVPDLHGAVFSTRGDGLTVWAKRNGVDVAIVPPEDHQFPRALHVADLDGVPLVAHHETLSIRAEGHIHAHAR